MSSALANRLWNKAGGNDDRWQLLYTSRPGSASPIQRAFTGTEAFTIFQEITLGQGQQSRVNNVVEFGENARCAPGQMRRVSMA